MSRPHYIYKVHENTATGKLLSQYCKKCEDATEQARQWALAQGADTFYESPLGMAGGCVAVEFNNTMSKKGWQRQEIPHSPFVFVPEPDSATEKEMFDLPVVSEIELFAILQSQPVIHSKTKKPLPMTFGNTTPSLFLENNYWHIDMPYICQAPDLILTE